jgi:hypothetical protein
VASVPDLGAAESGRCEAAVAKMLGCRINWAMLVATGAVNPRPEPERRYLAKHREGQRMQFPAAFRLRHDQAPMLGPAPYPRASPNRFHAACRINFLPAVLAGGNQKQNSVRAT